MRTNARTKKPASYTHEGARAATITPLQQLERSVLASFLFEDTFYEDGQTHVERIRTLMKQVPDASVGTLAVRARQHHNLRHVPLLLVALLARPNRQDRLVVDLLPQVIRRADEIGEFMSIYETVWGPTAKLSNQVRKGMQAAFALFNEYALAKYDRDSALWKIRDVARLTHPGQHLSLDSREQPQEIEAVKRDNYSRGPVFRHDLYMRMDSRTLKTPDTWEAALSGGADKKEAFTRLLEEGKLGYFALLRNLRNMEQAGVDVRLVDKAIRARKGGADKILPFRYVAAYKNSTRWPDALNEAFLAALKDQTPLDGHTLILVDTSGSMSDPLSAKSDMTRRHAAAALAAIFPGSKTILPFTTDLAAPIRQVSGFPTVDAILNARQGGTSVGHCTNKAQATYDHDRIIVITDEQSTDKMPDPLCEHAYCINVATYQNGIAYGAWTHIDGFSERVIDFIREYEK